MFTIVNNIAPIILMIVTGALIKRNWLTSKEFWRGIEKLSYFVLLPATLMRSILYGNFEFGKCFNLIFALTFASLIVIFILICIRKKFHFEDIKFTSVIQGSIRYNNYIFFALSFSLYKHVGLSISAMISAFMIIIVNIISIITFKVYADNSTNVSLFNFLISKLIRNPLIISVTLGLLLKILKIELIPPLDSFLMDLASAAITLGVLNIGAGLKFNFEINSIFPILLAVVHKLFLFPVVGVLIFYFFGINDSERDLALLYTCVPCSTTSYLLSKELGGDYESMSLIIMVTTILSIFSIPFMLYLLN